MLLRDLDSVIDFARASNQLAIILHLYNQNRPLSTDDLARDIVDSKKSVLDSIRKLEKKNLVVKREVYGRLYVELSEEGRKFVAKLLELIKPVYTSTSSVLETPVRLNIVKEMMVSLSVFKLLVKVGLTPPHAISVNKLQRILSDEKVSEIVLESFTKNPTRLFKVIGAGKAQLLALDKAGLMLLKKTPYYQVYSSSRVYRLLVEVFRTPLISELSTRLNTVFSIIVLVLSAITAVTQWYILAVPAAIMLALQVGLNLFLHKLSFLHV
jgi:DNA-binding MarR family transcriptional regulator